MTTWYNLAPQPNWQEWLGVTVSANPSSFPFSADSLTDTITVANGNNYFTGKSVMVSSIGGTLPSPLNASSVYYIIFLSTNSYKLASSYANAMAGTSIDLTDNGSGTLSIISTGVVYLQPNANGQIYTYSSLDHSVNKATYTDWTGNTQNTNPIILDDRGQAVIYWQVNSLLPTDNYYIEIYTADGVLLYTRDNFNAPPGLDSGSSGDMSNPINLLLNNEFDFWGMYDYGIDTNSDVVANVSVNNSEQIETAYRWWFNKSNNNATDTVTRKIFSAGQTDVPNTPVYYCQLSCSSAGSGGETFKNFFQIIDGVQNFAGETITLTFYAKSVTNGVIITPYIDQYFGPGGSTTVTTPSQDITLTTAWTMYTSTISVPSLNGKNIQPGNNFKIGWELPINSTYTIDLANIQLTVSPAALPYRQLSTNERFSLINADRQIQTGTIRPQAFGTIADTWMLFQAGTVGNGASNATALASPLTTSLFAALWENYDDTLCPVYDSSGAKVARGASASADYNNNRQIQLFFNAGRAITNTGIPSIYFGYTVTVDPTNTLTIAPYSSKSMYTGTAVTLTTTGTFPTGLAGSTTYYVIVVDPAAATYKLATSFANALAGTAITITGTGTGIQTLIVSAPDNEFATAVAGQAYGESAHAQTINELAAHNHSLTMTTVSTEGGSGANNILNQAGSTNTSTTGGGAYMNITQPTLALPHIIKL